jgi:nucleoside-diphosphate-sugar epimerase
MSEDSKLTYKSPPTSSEKGFDLPMFTNVDQVEPPTSSQYHVLLTGSTGSLGAYLLESLLSNPQILRITCLNRSSNAAERQRTNHTLRGLTTKFPTNRVEFLTCDLATDTKHDHTNSLGLDDSTGTKYKELLQNVTHLIHNAWAVDFNRHFSTFGPQIQGVRNLIEFTRQCALHPRLFFMSSVSVAGRWGAMPGALAEVPEIVLEDWRLAKMGYGQSKLVAERLIAEAVIGYGIDAAICRVAQVGGPVLRGRKGEWSRNEWLPSLIASSKTMGLIPATLGPMETVDWLPVDIVAEICVELLFSGVDGMIEGRKNEAEERNVAKRIMRLRKKTKTVRVWHVVNPNTTTWTSILPSIIDSMNCDIEPVDFVKWVDELERRDKLQQGNGEGVSGFPAAKLLSFFDDLRDKALRFPRTPSATLATKETVKHSKTMAKTPAVSPSWLQLWVKQWDF